MLFRNFQKTIDAILFGNNKKIPAIHQFCFSNGTELVSAAAYGAAAVQCLPYCLKDLSKAISHNLSKEQ